MHQNNKWKFFDFNPNHKKRERRMGGKTTVDKKTLSVCCRLSLVLRMLKLFAITLNKHKLMIKALNQSFLIISQRKSLYIWNLHSVSAALGVFCSSRIWAHCSYLIIFKHFLESDMMPWSWRPSLAEIGSIKSAKIPSKTTNLKEEIWGSVKV